MLEKGVFLQKMLHEGRKEYAVLFHMAREGKCAQKMVENGNYKNMRGGMPLRQAIFLFGEKKEKSADFRKNIGAINCEKVCKQLTF